METLIPDNLALLRDKALEWGAERASLFSARDVIVDERTRLKCLVPRCINYGRPMCPPNVPPVDEFRKALARYEQALLVQMAIGAAVEALNAGRSESATLAQMAEGSRQSASMSAARRSFYGLIARLEAEAFKLGYRYAAGFAVGNYQAALPVGEGPDRSEPPFFARPSMEAMGIDVVETARLAGLPLSFAEPSRLCFSGLILID
jgi:predicted metal-binding protein